MTRTFLLMAVVTAVWTVSTGHPEAAAWQTPVANRSAAAPSGSSDNLRWYRGNLHTHSLWSDGDDFPEMIVKWYADHGYHFMALTDHNILARGGKWMSLDVVEQRGGSECMEKYRAEFGDEWVRTRQLQGQTQVRLCPLQEYRGRFERPGKFLLVEAEEVSDSVDGLPVHLNASNLQELLQPTGGTSVRESIDANLRAAAEQAARSGRQILVHLNHPNFGWAITAEDLAAVTRARFFEVYNGHPSVNQPGDNNHPSVDRLWDIVNTLRLDKLDGPPLYGLATDDSHNYHRPSGSRPGRGWIWVRAGELSADTLVRAMYRGDFYASSGVQLDRIRFDAGTGEYSFEIVPAAGTTYRTQFIGTRRGYDEATRPRLDEQGQPIRSTRIYSSDIGEVLATSEALTPVYKLQGDELYVRAVVTSSRDHPDPSFASQKEQAWTQPVAWRPAKALRPPK
jgi:hypothetical protein